MGLFDDFVDLPEFAVEALNDPLGFQATQTRHRPFPVEFVLMPFGVKRLNWKILDCAG